MTIPKFDGKLIVIHGHESIAELRGGSDELEVWAIENLPEGIYRVVFEPIVPQQIATEGVSDG